ncbi:hypothetical protein PAXRUDRAFT_393342 [Paxillus rubicundulus Ve08.2h10]|uniref:TRIP4/RQT4 C2HC5-type zinc finger domain-containing protein n=1 Tax=Paxillus rubicundulus Ve08.2h10 TaxID=930991 RepID=A0A0D0E370_9AGAM|nr:hypothetical protein PAXRUDRAFT_393342 [Paxillus rubicundulus Ve08.2h10]
MSSNTRKGWSKLGSLPSDHIRLQHPPAVPKQQSKGKGRAGSTDPPKSSAVRTLEAFVDSVRKSSGSEKDPKGGCFCQARQHDLSKYVPLCRQCGLVLCTLNLPYHACPHCGGVLLDAFHHSALIVTLDEDLAKQIAQEGRARQRAIEEARIAAGAFPMLPGSLPPKSSRTPPPPPHSYKVLSLDSKTKRATVTSYTNTPAPSRPASRAEDVKEEEQRVPAPSPGISYVKEPPDPSRPWRNVRAGELSYVAARDGSRTSGHGSGRGR